MSKEQFVEDEFTTFISYEPQWSMAHPPYFNIKDRYALQRRGIRMYSANMLLRLKLNKLPTTWKSF
jgi:hypothetical protein